MKKISFFALIISSILILSACKKYEGVGGRSKIVGKLTVNEKLYINGVLSQIVSYPGSTK
jgi:hypothetical protein